MSELDKLLEGVEVQWKMLGEVAEIYGGLTGKSKADFEKGNISRAEADKKMIDINKSFKQ